MKVHIQSQLQSAILLEFTLLHPVPQWLSWCMVAAWLSQARLSARHRSHQQLTGQRPLRMLSSLQGLPPSTIMMGRPLMQARTPVLIRSHLPVSWISQRGLMGESHAALDDHAAHKT